MIVCPWKSHPPSCARQYFKALYTQHLHSVLAFLSYLGISSGGHIFNREDPLRPQERGSSRELPPAGYEPNRIVDNQIVDDQENVSFTGIEDRVRPLSFHQSIIAPTIVTAGSIATPPESDFDDEQFRALLASPLCTYRSEEQVQNDHKFITLWENAWCPVHLKIRSLSVQGNLSQCLQVRVGWGETHFPRERESHLLMLFLRLRNRFSDFPTRQVAKSLLDGNGDHLLTQARSKQMKQEHKVEPLTIALMSYSGKLMLNDWDCSTPITDMYSLEESKSPTARWVGHERERSSRHSD